MPVPDSSVVMVEGPWVHREVSANGTRFHAAEMGTPNQAPLVVLLHGFPQFWWTWRQQLIDLALDRGGDDNATAMAIRVREAGERPEAPQGWRRLFS